MVALERFVPWRSVDRRIVARHRFTLDAKALIADIDMSITIEDLSTHGLHAVSPVRLVGVKRLTIRQTELGDMSGRIIWMRGRSFGIAFDSPLHPMDVGNIKLQC